MGPGQKVERAEFESFVQTREAEFGLIHSRSTKADLLTERPGLTTLLIATASSYWNWRNSASPA